MSKDSHAFRGARDSRDGRFITKREADRRPSTTQKENIPKRGYGDSGRYPAKKQK